MRLSRPRSVSQAMIRPSLAISAARASVLPPAPAHRSTTSIPGRTAQPRQISWLPSSCTSIWPACQALGPFDRKAFDQAQPDRRVRRRLGVGQLRQRRFARALEPVGAKVERRALQARRQARARRPADRAAREARRAPGRPPPLVLPPRPARARAASRRTERAAPDPPARARASPPVPKPDARRCAGSRERRVRGPRAGPWRRRSGAP